MSPQVVNPDSRCSLDPYEIIVDLLPRAAVRTTLRALTLNSEICSGGLWLGSRCERGSPMDNRLHFMVLASFPQDNDKLILLDDSAIDKFNKAVHRKADTLI